MRPLITQWRPKQDHTIRLFTNGLLLKKQLDNNPIINNITQYFISIDAGSAEVYEQVRQPGKFINLLSNFDWLAQTVKNTGSSVLLKFVLQASNYHDMEFFVELCQRYNFSGVINRLEDWGTWSAFNEHDVIGNLQHPNHLAAIANLKDIYKKYHGVIQFNSSLARLACE
jgi:molybdenum cofactor biosynthesis enzyme MoaA